jgi:hypothetical protein
MSDNCFHGTASRIRAVWSDTVRWLFCCLCSGSCEHLGTGRWPLRKAGAVRASEMTYWRATAATRRHFCGRTGTCRYETYLFRRVVPTPDWATTTAGVTERSDSRRILTPGSFFYVEMWPPGQYSMEKSYSLFRRIHGLGVIFSMYVVEKWPRRKMTRGSFFYVEMWPSVNILRVSLFFV